jgi:hypothetical protein
MPRSSKWSLSLVFLTNVPMHLLVPCTCRMLIDGIAGNVTHEEYGMSELVLILSLVLFKFFAEIHEK